MQGLYPDASMADIFEYAYSALPEVRDVESARTKEISELTGMAKAYSKGAAGSDGMSGGGTSNTANTVKVRMTQAQKQHYDKLLISNPRIAQKYVQNIANGS
jgi:hypothetical protein